MLNTHNRKYGYNIEPTSPFGMIHLSEETKEKLSKALKGRKGTFLGRKHNEESKKKMSDVKKGKKVSSELIEKRRQKQVGKKRTKEQVPSQLTVDFIANKIFIVNKKMMFIYLF